MVREEPPQNDPGEQDRGVCHNLMQIKKKLKMILFPGASPTPTCNLTVTLSPIHLATLLTTACTTPSTVHHINTPTNITTQHYTT